MPIKRRQQKDGKTVFDVRIQYGGIRISRTVPTTFTEAKRVESKLLQELIQGRFDILKNKKNPKFKDYAEEYKKSVTWQKSYERTCDSLKPLIVFFGNKRLTEITVSDFIKYRTERLEKVKMPTINREHACIKRMLNLAVQSDDYILNKNPVAKIKLFKEFPVEDRTLTVDEYNKILDAAPEYFRRIILFACHTAMRKMEILNLKFHQIKIWPSGEEIELIDTKSGDKETIPLDPDAAELIFEIAKERGIDLRNISVKDGMQYVFTGKRGKRLRDIRHPMKITFDRAGLEYRPFHTFRHFWTSEMFNAGVDVGKIKKIGRWGDMHIMLRYCHSNKTQEHEAVKALSEYLKRKPARVVDLKKETAI